MSKIKINDLNPSESQVSQLSNLELTSVVGGSISITIKIGFISVTVKFD